MRAVRVRVTGRVQGVFYRGWTQEEAEALGLTGWVRNERDGAVTALLVGPDAQVEAMLAAMRRGPPAAQVAEVTVAAAEAEPTAGFEIRR
jgi:acylphosphatase